MYMYIYMHIQCRMKSTVEQEGTRQEPIRGPRIECAGWLLPLLVTPTSRDRKGNHGRFDIFYIYILFR